jgi:hypothetical protein
MCDSGSDRTELRRAWDEASAKDRAEIIGLVMNLPVTGPEWAEFDPATFEWTPFVPGPINGVGFRIARVTTYQPLAVTIQTTTEPPPR